ncbi:hypothetical protein NP493_154g04022 [Ridgeia piscesae]|uniref:Uncharacterized protein n=1 Tax=Ridgeia piscesae TaxID=27915 RepID=A0AAD9UFV8_RIDPI|nr:hypothetical protein NP493_154g04022 [Ridgeia piscesae]
MVSCSRTLVSRISVLCLCSISLLKSNSSRRIFASRSILACSRDDFAFVTVSSFLISSAFSFSNDLRLFSSDVFMLRSRSNLRCVSRNWSCSLVVLVISVTMITTHCYHGNH